MTDNLIRYIKGVGPRKEEVFNNLGVYTVKDLLYYFPFRYEDRSNFKEIKDLEEGISCVVKGVVYVKNLKKIPYFVRTTKVRSIFEVVLKDKTGIVEIIWFNQHYLDDLINTGDEIIIYGKPTRPENKLRFVSPEYEISEKGDNSLNIGRIVGAYKLTASLTQKFIRRIIFSCLNNFKRDSSDSVPFYIRKENNFPNIVESLENIHFPVSWIEAERARERFIFEELFFSQVLVYLRKAKHRLQKGVVFKIDKAVLEKIKDNLSFQLTSTQEQALSQILEDLGKDFPMHRLLQGDVGCGKTVVAAFAIGVCVSGGYQAALMVPTEILCYQHKDTLDKLFSGFNFKIEVLSASLAKKKAEEISERLKEGSIDIIVGTHSLIQENIAFKKLGLVVIDEQHKFGVAQRALLPKKGNLNPHCLVMSATPIPRSLALSLYGDLDLSVINELPQGRLTPQTMWVKEDKREWVYEFMEGKLKEGRQVYIIYPVIDESQDEDLKSLEEMYEKILKIFPSYKAGKFHGEIKNEQKRRVIKEFIEKKIDILISTTVVEVGVNIENATVMVVENPERFGLAQLHQLRGRIQRSIHKPYFILLSKDELSDIAQKRLKIISQTSDGFKIAEEDLNIRGPGDFFGSLQHGLPRLKIANPLRDLEMLALARSFAYKVIKSDPYLEKPYHRCIREHLDFWFQKQ